MAVINFFVSLALPQLEHLGVGRVSCGMCCVSYHEMLMEGGTGCGGKRSGR